MRSANGVSLKSPMRAIICTPWSSGLSVRVASGEEGTTPNHVTFVEYHTPGARTP
jgi:hypothetical protein